MKSNILFCLAFLCTSISYAQTLTILNKESDEPLEGVFINSNDPKASAISNTKGQMDLSAFKNADVIVFQSMGYATLRKSYDQLLASNFQVKLFQTGLNLNQVVVSATKWRQDASKVVSKISSISTKDVALQNPQTAADLLGLSGAVFIQKSQQGGGSPMIRGFATNRLIYTIDGVRMNTAIFRGGNIQNVINLDPFTTENTEVLFGPGSVIYGSDAIGGVMSFQTLTPQLSDTDSVLVKGKALSRYASANLEQTGHFDINLGWKKWALVSSFSTWDYDHLRQGSKGPDDYLKNQFVQRQDSSDVLIKQDDPLLQIPSAYAQLNLMQKVRFKPNEAWDFQYGLHYSTTSPYGRYDRHNRVLNGTARYGEWNYGPQSWMMNQLSINHNQKSGLYDQMSIRLAVQNFGESRISRDLNDPTREVREERVDAYSANVDFTKQTSKRNTVFYGAEFVQNDVQSTGRNEIIFNNGLKPDSIVAGSSRYPNAIWQSAAVYVNNTFTVNEKINLQGGVRYNYFTLDADFSNNADFFPFTFEAAEIRNDALTGSFGAIYKANASLLVKANFGTAFRAPNVDDVGKIFDSQPLSVVVPNPNLGAEYAYNVDLGFAKIFNQNLKIDVSTYYTLLNQAHVVRNDQVNGRDSIVYDGVLSQVQSVQNAAEARVYGLQVGIEAKLLPGLSFLSDLNFQVGEEELSDGSISPSRHAAPFFGVSRLRYQNKQLTLEVNAQYQGQRASDDLAFEEQNKTEIYALDANGETFAPAWYTLNVKAMVALNQTFTLSTGLENITDQRYRPYSSGLSGAGRNFILSVSAQF